MKLAREMNVEVRVENVPREALYTVDEMFFSGTAVEVTPIRSVDGIPVGSGKPGPITMRLQKEFMAIAEGRVPDRHNWTTLVPEGVTAG
jgi:branched-chain amino acid aminotransferase